MHQTSFYPRASRGLKAAPDLPPGGVVLRATLSPQISKKVPLGAFWYPPPHTHIHPPTVHRAAYGPDVGIGVKKKKTLYAPRAAYTTSSFRQLRAGIATVQAASAPVRRESPKNTYSPYTTLHQRAPGFLVGKGVFCSRAGIGSVQHHFMLWPNRVSACSE